MSRWSSLNLALLSLASAPLIFWILRRTAKASRPAAHRGPAPLDPHERALLGEILERSSDAIFAKDAEGRYLLCNREVARVSGRSHEEISGRDDAWLFPAEQARRIRDNDLQVMRANEVCSYEETLATVDGEVTYLVTKGPLRTADGLVNGVFGISRDITARKQMIATLERSRSQLRTFVDAAPVNMAMFDREMRYLAYSARWHRQFGAGRDLHGLCHYDVLPDLPAEWRDLHKRGLAGENLSNDADLWLRADGKATWLRWGITPWTDEHGEVGGIIITNEDVTDQVASRKAERRIQAELERRVAQRTAALTAANRDLDSFAYAVAHDLRGPLRAMSGYSQALIEDYAPNLDADARRHLEQIDGAARRMAGMIDGILALSHSARGELRQDRFDVSLTARRILGELARRHPERQVRCEVEDGLELDGDAGMLESVMQNLLSNAWKYTSKSATAHIRVYRGSVDGREGICVADDGAGFDMAYADDLFKPFHRLHHQSEFSGLGIGLATALRIVQRHGGTMRAQARPGQGATFCFDVGHPVLPAKAAVSSI